MRLIKDFLTSIFKNKHKNEPWLDYYSREERSIKFTNKSIYDFLIDQVGEDKDYIALNYFENRISYNEFFDNINISARALRSYGVKEKDVVTICLPNMPEAIYAFYACNKIGAIADIIHPLSSPEQINFYLRENKSRFLFLVDFNYAKCKDAIATTLVYKTILVSPKLSMPLSLSIGYTLTRSIKTKRPSRREQDFISWKEFMLRGVTYNKEFKADVKKMI